MVRVCSVSLAVGRKRSGGSRAPVPSCQVAALLGVGAADGTMSAPNTTQSQGPATAQMNNSARPERQRRRRRCFMASGWAGTSRDHQSRAPA